MYLAKRLGVCLERARASALGVSIVVLNCFVLLTGVVAEDRACPEKIAAFIERCEKALPESIKAVEMQIKLVSSTKYVRATPQERKEAKEKLKAILAELKEGKTLPVLRIPLNVVNEGDIGFMTSGEPNQPAIVRVFQVIDGDSLLAKYGGRIFWLNMPTGNLTDDAPLVLKDVLEVAGTQTYDTAAGGSKTVYRLERFDIDVARYWFEKMRDSTPTVEYAQDTQPDTSRKKPQKKDLPATKPVGFD
jgi:hypothetical protein